MACPRCRRGSGEFVFSVAISGEFPPPPKIQFLFYFRVSFSGNG